MPGADQEHQGHLGDLASKTTPELKDLLRRQESILQKQKFLRSLPDAGRKLRASAENLHRVIIERQRREDRQAQWEANPPAVLSARGVKPPSQFAKLRDNNALALDVDGSDLGSGADLDLSMRSLTVQDPNEADLSHLINPACRPSDKVYVKEEPFAPESVNSYLKAIQRSSHPSAQTKQHFKPHSSLNIATVSELPEKFRGQNVKKPEESCMEEESCQKTNVVTGRVLDHKNAESSATLPKYKYESVKVISLDESFQLQKSQAQKQEELRAQHAAERLTGKLHFNMEPYLPEGKMVMAYRSPEGPDENLDSDDNEEEDYPD